MDDLVINKIGKYIDPDIINVRFIRYNEKIRMNPMYSVPNDRFFTNKQKTKNYVKNILAILGTPKELELELNFNKYIDNIFSDIKNNNNDNKKNVSKLIWKCNITKDIIVIYIEILSSGNQSEVNGDDFTCLQEKSKTFIPIIGEGNNNLGVVQFT
tara:strand:+ start:6671 stop:7138 length:468 start_codon:yes stop_codon:yes gene_type:complete